MWGAGERQQHTTESQGGAVHLVTRCWVNIIQAMLAWPVDALRTAANRILAGAKTGLINVSAVNRADNAFTACLKQAVCLWCNSCCSSNQHC